MIIIIVIIIIISKERPLVLCAIILSMFNFLMPLFMYYNYLSRAILLSLCGPMLEFLKAIEMSCSCGPFLFPSILIF